ncbi:MAG: DMT family protein [Candidatus Delongbacteria bacterium]|nr:DMT family protein [Candidatus Delongbacteria bacterium]MBN2834020.1 DMT family protein [Candidatus Delongbacteria bacterium]
MRGFYAISLLIISNSFMFLAWYGHLKFSEMKWFSKLGLFSVILISWGIALFEYIFQVPANRLGFNEHGGPFTLVQLKVLQEIITLGVFVVMSRFLFKTESLNYNHLTAFILLVLAVYFIFKK